MVICRARGGLLAVSESFTGPGRAAVAARGPQTLGLCAVSFESTVINALVLFCVEQVEDLSGSV